MIGKVSTGKSFRGCLLYCLNDKKQPSEKEAMEGRAELIKFNQCFGNQQELIAQFNAVRQLNPKLSKPVLHITLSLAPGEQLSKDKLMEMCEHCAKEMGFENNQYIAVHHLDTKHQHIHIIANRIDFDKCTVSDSNNYKKIAAYCRKMEQLYGLREVLNPRRFLPEQQRSIPRLDQRKVQIKRHVQQSLAASRSYEEFERLMKEKKYEVIKGRGIAFRDEKKVYVKGSEVGFPLQKIEHILEQNKIALDQMNIANDKRRINPSNQFGEKEAFKQWNLSSSNNQTENLSKMIDHLMRLDDSNVATPYELTHNKKKKRKGQKPQ